MNRDQLLTVLKINGLEPTAPEEDVRAVLRNARYSAHEVESALHILRDANAIEDARVDGLHRVFYSDEHLRPNEVASLLGVEMQVDMPIKRWKRGQDFTETEIWIIVIGSILIAVITTVTCMAAAEAGYFYGTGA